MGASNNVGYATVTAGTAAVDLVNDASLALPANAKGAIITTEVDSLRWRANGTPASSTEGHQVAKDGEIIFDSWTAPKANWQTVLRAITFIRSSTSDVKVKISYFD